MLGDITATPTMPVTIPSPDVGFGMNTPIVLGIGVALLVVIWSLRS